MVASNNMNGDIPSALFFSVVALAEELWPGLSCGLGLQSGCVSQVVLSPTAEPCSAQTLPSGLTSKHPQPSCPAGVSQQRDQHCIWPMGGMGHLGQMYFNAAQQSRAVGLQK